MIRDARRSSGNELLERLHRLMSRFKRHMHSVLRDETEVLAPMEARTLDFFSRHLGATQSDLAAHAGRDKAQIARVVKVLIEGDLLQARPDPGDGRSQRLHLTTSGQAVQRRLRQHRARFEADLLADLSAAERHQLFQLLDRLIDGPANQT